MVTKDMQTISEEFWRAIYPLIPSAERAVGRSYKRKSGAGRKPLSPRLVLEAILYVLRTGCPWKALPKERYGSPSSIHRYYRSWLGQGFFHAVWQAGLAESEEMEGIAWRWGVLPDNACPEGSLGVLRQGPVLRDCRTWMPCKEVRRCAGAPDAAS